MAGKEVATYNENAISIKKYLNSDGIKAQIFAAAPKMLNGERFLKVFYGACLRNPKLLDCTTESMLQAAMFFAQLGLEPILGRAYLVPYLNSKNIEGRWVKQLEVQAQVGYQGLVDLARRSGTISDVWGACVYENDLFDLSYGMDRTLVHKPWFLDPEKRKANNPGEFIGAYVVWKLKDETKHPEFMPAHEIYKRRAKSQSYQYAEFGDPAKGGGKKDSVWHQWHDDMSLKTVIKHSAKIVPASIEFMSAVQMDNDSEAGRQAFPMLEGGGNGGNGGGLKLPEPSPSDFDTYAQEKLAENRQDALAFAEFTVKTADGNGMDLDAFKAKVMAEGRFNDLWAAFENTKAPAPPMQNNSKEPASPPPAEEKALKVGDPTAREHWIKLRGAGYGDYVLRHIDAFRNAPPATLDEARGKWINIYKDEIESKPWPLATNQAPPPPPPAAPKVETNGVKQGAPEDPEAAEFDYLLTQIKSKAAIDGGIYVFQAQKDLRYPVGLQHIDSCSLDALRELLEATEKLLADRPPRS